MFTFLSARLRQLGLLSAICLLAVTANAQSAPTWASVQRNGEVGPGNNNNNGDRIAVSANGSTYVTGSYYGTITLGGVTLTPGPGGKNRYLARYDVAGILLWVNKIDSPDVLDGATVAVDAAGNAYLSGPFFHTVSLGSTTITSTALDVYLVKYDAQGVQQWVRQGGSPGVKPGGLAIDPSGNVSVSGYFETAVSFGGPTVTGGGIFLTKLSPLGTVIQSIRVGTGELTSALAYDGAGNAYMSGSFRNTSTFGTTTVVSAGDLDMFLCKLDPAGNILWARREGGLINDIATGVAVDSNGNVLVSGSADDDNVGSKIYVALFTTQGAALWSRQIASTTASLNFATQAAYDNRGGCYITGGFHGTVVFGNTTLSNAGLQPALFIARFNSQGTAVWADQPVASPGSFSFGTGLAFDAAGNGYLSGTFEGDAALGTIATTGGVNAFFAKLLPGSVLTATHPTAAVLALSTYPNPAVAYTTLELLAGGGNLMIVDALGRVVREQALPVNAGAYAVALSGIAVGIYELRVNYGNGQTARTQLAIQ